MTCVLQIYKNMDNLEIKQYTNSELTQKILKENLPGAFYYSNFIQEKESSRLISVLEKIDYQIFNGKPTKYFGIDYSSQKKVHNSNYKLDPLPHFFNVIKNKLNYNYHQLVIEYLRPNDHVSLKRESNLFEDNVLILHLGGHFKYDMFNDETNEHVEFLIEPGSLLMLSGESRYKWKRSIKNRIKERFNHQIIPRKEHYILTFRRINESI